MTKQTQVKEIKFIKDGVSAKGLAWALYNLVDSDGDRYSVFGSLLNEKGVKSGDAVLLNFKEESWEKNGKKGKNRNITDVSRLNTANMPSNSVKTPISSDSGVSRKEFDELKHRVAFLEEELLGTAEIKSKDLF